MLAAQVPKPDDEPIKEELAESITAPEADSVVINSVPVAETETGRKLDFGAAVADKPA